MVFYQKIIHFPHPRPFQRFEPAPQESIGHSLGIFATVPAERQLSGAKLHGAVEVVGRTWHRCHRKEGLDDEPVICQKKKLVNTG